MTYDAAVILAHGLNKDRSLNEQTRERTDLGVKYFREGRIKHLLMSGGHSDIGECYGISLAKIMKNYAVSMGVPSKFIFEEDLSLETVGQLIFCKIGVINPKMWRNILIITHDYHILRVRTISDVIFGIGYNIELGEVGSNYDIEKEILEKERVNRNLFKKTFKEIKIGNDKVLLKRLLEKHNKYNFSVELFKTRLESLTRENSFS